MHNRKFKKGDLVYIKRDTFLSEWQGDWTTATDYDANDSVFNDGSSYICVADHTSGAASEPGVGGSWESYWDLMSQKSEMNGPASSTDSAIALFDGTTGKLLKDSTQTISDIDYSNSKRANRFFFSQLSLQSAHKIGYQNAEKFFLVLSNTIE